MVIVKMFKKNTDVIIPLILLFGLIGVIINIGTVTDFVAALISPNSKVTIPKANEYAKNENYIYVKKSEDFVPYSKQDLVNIFYSILDNGYETFTFYCPSEYSDCMSDVISITQNQTVITDIGNFVHPYNNFTNIKVVTGSLGEVNVVITKNYTAEQIRYTNEQIDKMFSQVIHDEMDVHDKILAIHDYIIDYTSYDKGNGDFSGTAYGLFKDRKCKCAGYADAMAIVLNKLGLKNYKVASTQHVWNAVYIDDAWYQIDLTWDDPVVENGTNITDNIRHKFYMIDTKTLHSYDTKEHSFNLATYAELK